MAHTDSALIEAIHDELSTAMDTAGIVPNVVDVDYRSNSINVYFADTGDTEFRRVCIDAMPFVFRDLCAANDITVGRIISDYEHGLVTLCL